MHLLRTLKLYKLTIRRLQRIFAEREQWPVSFICESTSTFGWDDPRDNAPTRESYITPGAVLQTGGTSLYIYFIDSGKASGYLWNYVARNEVGLDSPELLIAAWGNTRPPFSFGIVYWRCNLSNRCVYNVTLVWSKT